MTVVDIVVITLLYLLIEFIALSLSANIADFIGAGIIWAITSFSQKRPFKEIINDNNPNAILFRRVTGGVSLLGAVILFTFFLKN